MTVIFVPLASILLLVLVTSTGPANSLAPRKQLSGTTVPLRPAKDGAAAAAMRPAAARLRMVLVMGGTPVSWGCMVATAFAIMRPFYRSTGVYAVISVNKRNNF